MFDDRQTAVLYLENLSFAEVVYRRQSGERYAALSALVRLTDDDPVRLGDLPQSYAFVTDLSADLQS